MIRLLLYKWFGLDSSVHCEACEILREQLHKSERERTELLHRLLDQNKSEPPSTKDEEELVPINPKFVPWRVRKEMLEAEDRKKAELIRRSKENSEKLEKELGVEEK